MRDNAADRLVPPPASGRLYRDTRRVHVGDCDAAGLLRLDALARIAQDIAGDDTADAGGGHGAWVVRRTVVVTDRPARLREDLELSTWCSGLGRRWAERRVRLRGGAGATIDVVSLWVSIDPATGRPQPIGPTFRETYGEAAAGREVTARLRLDPAPPAGAGGQPWSLRAVDLDVLGHVNNAASCAAVEELLAAMVVAGARPAVVRRGRVELEHRRAIEPGARVTLRWSAGDDVVDVWLMTAAGDPGAGEVAEVDVPEVTALRARVAVG